MSVSGKKTMDNLFFKLALLTGVVVLSFSVFNKHYPLMIILRTVIAFLIIFILGRVLTLIWTKLSIPDNKDTDKNTSSDNKSSRIDFVLGDFGEQNMPGQINRSMTDGTPDAKTKAEITKKMGLDGEE